MEFGENLNIGSFEDNGTKFLQALYKDFKYVSLSMTLRFTQGHRINRKSKLIACIYIWKYISNVAEI